MAHNQVLPQDQDSGLEHRVPTGVSGLDYILGGGLPANHLYLVEGDPGAGKTTLALQYLLDGLKQGERGLYVTLSESKSELRTVAASHGWSLDGMGLFELGSLEQRLLAEEQYTVFHPSEVELAETTKLICEEVEKLQPTRVVFDSLSEMRLLAREALRYRRQVLALKQFFAGRNCTVLLLDDRTSETNDLQLQSISHGVIVLERVTAEYGGSRRRLMVSKMRGLQFREGFHDFSIKRGGLQVYPRLVAAEERSRTGAQTGPLEVAPSGSAAMDTLMGGGLQYGTNTLIMGPAGAGKSSLVTQYTRSLADAGERVICYIFEETRENFLIRAAGVGLDLRAHVESGQVRVEQIDPAEMSPGEFVDSVRRAVSREESRRIVVIDSLNGYLNAMPSEGFLLIQMHELLMYLNELGVLSLMVLAQNGIVGTSMQSPIDVTYLADTVVMLRYFEAFGTVRQAVAVVKKRTGPHERSIREFHIDSTGVHIGEPLKDFGGILTGVPEYHGRREDLIKEREE